LLGVLPPARSIGHGLDPRRLPRSTARVALGVLDGLRGARTGRHSAALP
jgi:hypothetical protein